MRVLRFQIRNPQGMIETLNVESESVLIGTAAHCEIRLPLDASKPEHLRIDVGPNGVFGTTLDFNPPPTLNGIPFTAGLIPPDATLGVGYMQMQLQIMEGGVGGAGAKNKEKKTSPLSLVGFVALLIGAYFLLFDDDPNSDKFAAPEGPPLWQNTAAPVCPEQGEQAREFARQRYGMATIKRERRPYYVQDGIAAVPLFELAGACFRAAGASEEARQSDAVASAMKIDLNREYRKRQVAFGYHARLQDWNAARKDVRSLLAFTDGQQGKYRTWLKDSDRRLLLRAPSR